MKGIFVAVLIALSFTIEADASGRNGVFATFSYKSLGSCGKFIKKRRSGSNSFQEDWMRGYMTAVNKHVKGKTNFFDGVDPEGVLLWI